MRIEVNQQVYLETVNRQHAEPLFKLIDENRNHLKQWMTWIDKHLSVADTIKFIDESETSSKNFNGFNAAIFYEHALCGIIGLHYINWHYKNTETGYWLAADFQGKGIMTAACRAMVNHCLNKLNLHRVEIRCAAGNFKSQAIPDRLGFTREATLREIELLNGVFVDQVVFSILKPEWKAFTSAKHPD